MNTVTVLFGTRPELIKLAPVIQELRSRADRFETLVVSSSQHTDLLRPVVERFGISIDRDLNVMRPNQSPLEVCQRVLAAFEVVLRENRPDAVVVQGDTTTTLAGALAAFHARIPVAHVEAGLRTDDRFSPFPEEMNRRLVTRLATLHFAATEKNRIALLTEGVPAEAIYCTGNPGIDALRYARDGPPPSDRVQRLIEETRNLRLVTLTTHRRESFGPVMEGNLGVLRHFVARHSDVGLVFPVHPNPEVRNRALRILSDTPRVWLIEPLEYFDFVQILANSWLIVSDSGGIQEEAPSLGRPLLILRENTERPESIECGVARLVGNDADRLAVMLGETYSDRSWERLAAEAANPYGDGRSAQRIVDALDGFLEKSHVPLGTC